MPSYGRESQRGNSASFPPYKQELPLEIQPYWDICHNLSSCRRSHAGIRTHVAAIVWVSRPALNPPRHKSTPAARQTESDPAPTTLFPLFYFWVVPVRLGPPPLPALTPDRSPPRPPILARLDPHTSIVLGPPWPSIVARLGSRSLSALIGPRFWPALTCYGHPLRNSKQE